MAYCMSVMELVIKPQFSESPIQCSIEIAFFTQWKLNEKIKVTLWFHRICRARLMSPILLLTTQEYFRYYLRNDLWRSFHATVQCFKIASPPYWNINKTYFVSLLPLAHKVNRPFTYPTLLIRLWERIHSN